MRKSSNRRPYSAIEESSEQSTLNSRKAPTTGGGSGLPMSPMKPPTSSARRGLPPSSAKHSPMKASPTPKRLSQAYEFDEVLGAERSVKVFNLVKMQSPANNDLAGVMPEEARSSPAVSTTASRQTS